MTNSKIPKSRKEVRAGTQSLVAKVHNEIHETHFPISHICKDGTTRSYDLLELFVETTHEPKLALYSNGENNDVDVTWLFRQRCKCGGLIEVTLTDNMHPELVENVADYIRAYAGTHGVSIEDAYHFFKEQVLDYHVTHGQIAGK